VTALLEYVSGRASALQGGRACSPKTFKDVPNAYSMQSPFLE
jgi:hypothetical protein